MLKTTDYKSSFFATTNTTTLLKLVKSLLKFKTKFFYNISRNSDANICAIYHMLI